MSDTYVECLVKAKQSTAARFLKMFLVALAVIGGVGTFVFFPAIIVVLLAGAGAYLLNLFTDLEYEYLYLDRELTIDKVMARARRKRIATYSVDRIEILAPVRSYRLDPYRNRQGKPKDYSIGEVLQPDQRYIMYYEGGECILLSPSQELVRAMKNVAPRKVFTD